MLARTNVEYRVRSYIYAGNDLQETIGGRTVLIRGGSTVYSQWGNWRGVAISDDISGFDGTTITEEPQYAALASPLGVLVSIPATMAGVPEREQVGLVVAAAILASAIVGIGFAALTAATPMSVYIGACMALLAFAIGAPTLAGLSPYAAAAPVVGLVAIGAFMLKSRSGR